MILRLLLLAGLIWLAWQLWQQWRRHTAVPPPRPQERFEPMSRCAQCGVYMPTAALSKSGRCGKCSE
jgi:hypothetical protein